MSQFDLYRNPNSDSRKQFPLLLDIQNPVIEQLNTRIVIPLTPAQHSSLVPLRGLTPELEIDGKKYLLLTPQLSSIQKRLLKNPVGSLAHQRQQIIAALDFAITCI